jgi:hypothetical protein
MNDLLLKALQGSDKGRWSLAVLAYVVMQLHSQDNRLTALEARPRTTAAKSSADYMRSNQVAKASSAKPARTNDGIATVYIGGGQVLYY